MVRGCCFRCLKDSAVHTACGAGVGGYVRVLLLRTRSMLLPCRFTISVKLAPGIFVVPIFYFQFVVFT